MSTLMHGSKMYNIHLNEEIQKFIKKLIIAKMYI